MTQFFPKQQLDYIKMACYESVKASPKNDLNNDKT